MDNQAGPGATGRPAMSLSVPSPPGGPSTRHCGRLKCQYRRHRQTRRGHHCRRHRTTAHRCRRPRPLPPLTTNIGGTARPAGATIAAGTEQQPTGAAGPARCRHSDSSQPVVLVGARAALHHAHLSPDPGVAVAGGRARSDSSQPVVLVGARAALHHAHLSPDPGVAVAGGRAGKWSLMAQGVYAPAIPAPQTRM